MRTKLMLLLLTVMISGSLFAQTQKPKVEQTPQKVAERMTAALKKAITLTPAQEKKVYEINLEYARKIAEIKKQKAVLDEKHNTDLEALYTTEQKAQIAAMKTAQQKERRDRENDPNVQKITVRQ